MKHSKKDLLESIDSSTKANQEGRQQELLSFAKLDLACHPHIFRLIISFLPKSGLPKIIRLSRSVSQEAAARLYQTVILDPGRGRYAPSGYQIRPGAFRQLVLSPNTPTDTQRDMFKHIQVIDLPEHDMHGCRRLKQMSMDYLRGVKAIRYCPNDLEFDVRCGRGFDGCRRFWQCGVFDNDSMPPWLVLLFRNYDQSYCPTSFICRANLCRLAKNVRRITVTIPWLIEVVQRSNDEAGAKPEDVFVKEIDLICTPGPDGTIDQSAGDVNPQAMASLRDQLVRRLTDTTCTIRLIGTEMYKLEMMADTSVLADDSQWSFEAEVRAALDQKLSTWNSGIQGESKAIGAQDRVKFMSMNDYLRSSNAWVVFDEDTIDLLHSRLSGDRRYTEAERNLPWRGIKAW